MARSSRGVRRKWLRKRILIPSGLIAVIGGSAMAGAGSPASSTIASSTVARLVASTAAPSSSTMAPTTVASSVAAATATTRPPVSTSIVVNSTQPSTASTTRATLPPTTVATTQATVVVTSAAASGGVIPGAYCTPVGATGVAANGKEYVCSTTKADGTPYVDGRGHWRPPAAG